MPWIFEKSSFKFLLTWLCLHSWPSFFFPICMLLSQMGWSYCIVHNLNFRGLLKNHKITVMLVEFLSYPHKDEMYFGLGWVICCQSTLSWKMFTVKQIDMVNKPLMTDLQGGFLPPKALIHYYIVRIFTIFFSSKRMLQLF